MIPPYTIDGLSLKINVVNKEHFLLKKVKNELVDIFHIYDVIINYLTTKSFDVQIFIAEFTYACALVLLGVIL